MPLSILPFKKSGGERTPPPLLLLRRGSCNSRFTIETDSATKGVNVRGCAAETGNIADSAITGNLLAFGNDFDTGITIRTKFKLFPGNVILRRITDNAPPECAEILNELEGDYGTSCSSIARMEKLCRLLSCIEKSETGKISSRLAPAINFLQENATEKINCAHLAELCFLGTSRFYELFKRELGATPLEYRDDLLIRRAASMLEAGDVSVKEAALAAGFENTAYFSRFFKKHTGLSPTEYTKNHTYKL